jgi:hypothetical protein
MAEQKWLTRAEIDAVLEGLSAGDLVEAMDGVTDQTAKMPVRAFDLAAARQGLTGKGEKASTRVRATDFRYLAAAIGEAVNVESPLSEGTAALLDSADSGE